jgi:hypothetical protein
MDEFVSPIQTLAYPFEGAAWKCLVLGLIGHLGKFAADIHFGEFLGAVEEESAFPVIMLEATRRYLFPNQVVEVLELLINGTQKVCSLRFSYIS